MNLAMALLIWGFLALVLTIAAWTVGPRPLTPVGWGLLLVLGPPLALMPYALLTTYLAELRRFALARWGRPRRRSSVDPRRLLLLLGAAICAAIPLGALVWLMAGPLRAFVEPIGIFLGRHFGSAR